MIKYGMVFVVSIKYNVLTQKQLIDVHLKQAESIVSSDALI